MQLIKNDFKTIQFSAFFSDLDRLEDRMYRFLLPKVLIRTNDHYPTKKAMSERLEELYGAYFRSRTETFANHSIVQFSLNIANPLIVKDKTLFRDAMRLFQETIFERQTLSKEVFEEEKRNLIELYEGMKDRKRSYAQIRFFNHFYRGQADGQPLSKRLKEVKAASYEGLLAYYEKMMCNRVHRFLNGNLNQDMEEMFKSTSYPDSDDGLPLLFESRKKRKVKVIHEKLETKQAILWLGYQLPVFVKDSLYDAALLLDVILGEYPESRLFSQIREKEGLCYDIGSSYDGYRGVLFINAGLSMEKRQHAKNAILDLVNTLIKNGISSEELEAAKAYLAHSLKSSFDSQSAQTYRRFTQTVLEDHRSMEERLASIESVRQEDILSVLEKLYLDTIYLLEDEHD